MGIATTEVISRELIEARLAVYRFLLAALDKPTADQHTWFASTAFRRSLEELSHQFDVALAEEEWATPGLAEHEARYLACFEVGLPAPPVPLLASHYNRREPVTALIHEHLLFYRCFGASPAAGNIEPADHLLNELTFLIWLDERLLRGGEAVPSILRGRRDFLRRQAAAWPGRAARAAAENGLPAVYRTLLGILAGAVAEDLTLAGAAVAHVDGEKS